MAEGVPVISSAGDSKPVVGGPEAELKAAQLRASKPLEERQQEFKAMLLERGVSAVCSGLLHPCNQDTLTGSMNGRVRGSSL